MHYSYNQLWLIIKINITLNLTYYIKYLKVRSMEKYTKFNWNNVPVLVAVQGRSDFYLVLQVGVPG